MTDKPESFDSSIPVLTDVMVTGHEPHAPHELHEPHAKAKRPKRSGSHAHEGSHARGKHAAAPDAQDLHEAPHDVHAEPQTPAVNADDDVPVLDSIYESPHAPMREPAQFVPGEAEFSSGSTAEQYVAPPLPSSLKSSNSPSRR